MRFPALILSIWPIGLLGCAGPAKGPPDELLVAGRKAYAAKDYREAERQFDGVFKYHTDSDEAEEGIFMLAETLRHRHKGQLSFTMYKKFADRYPHSRFSVGAARGEYRLGMDHFEGRIPGFLFFSADRRFGTDIMQHMQLHYRNSSLADDGLSQATRYYLRKKEYDEAAVVLRRLLAEYPRSEHVLWGRFQLGRCYWLLNEGADYDERQLHRSARAYRDFIGTARQMDQAEKLAKQIRSAEAMIKRIDDRLAQKNYKTGRFYERTKRPTSAVYYYRILLRDHPRTQYAVQARARLKALGAETPADEEPEEAAAQ